jgi:hypothetical protein
MIGATMYDKLKKQPLLGLALAIAVGYVLAHIVTRALDVIYEDALGSDPTAAAEWLLAIALVGFASYIAPRLYRSYRRKFFLDRDPSTLSSEGFRKRIIVSVVSVLLLTSLVIVCLAWPRSISIAVTIGVLAVLYYLVVKVYRWRKNEPWRMNFAKDQRWLAFQKATLLRDAAECMAEADAATVSPEGTATTPQVKYDHEVYDCFDMMDEHRERIFYAHLDEAFRAAAADVYKAGFHYNVPPKFLAGFIAKAAARHQKNPSSGIEYLKETSENFPRLWPEVSEPVLQRMMAEFLGK